jgi:5-methylcytosine-specific restriction enzyme A
MAKDYAKRFYNSKAWKECRAGYINHVHGLCERCSSPGKIVHHKEYITPENINDPLITLNWSNLEYVCQDCHNREHMELYSPVREGLFFDSDGNLIQK